MFNILVFLHSNYLLHNAGVEKVVLEQQQIFNDYGIDFFAVCPIPRIKTIFGQHVPLPTQEYVIIKNGEELGKYSFSELETYLLGGEWTAIIIHHLKNYNYTNSLFKMIKLLSQKAPMFFYIHDFATICFNHVLMKQGKYCSHNKVGLDFKKCCTCKFYLLAIFQNKFYKKLFQQIQFNKIIFPSEIVYQIWHTVYNQIPTTKCEIIPHQKFSDKQIPNIEHMIDKIKIAYVGYASPEKGWNFWKRMVDELTGFSNYSFYVLGRSTVKIPHVIQQEVSFLRDGNDAMVKALRNNKIDIAVLWSKCPETYSYTFFEAYISGAFIITSVDSGNIAYMVEKMHCGKVFGSENECLKWLKNDSEVQRQLELFFELNNERPDKLIANNKIIEILHEST